MLDPDVGLVGVADFFVAKDEGSAKTRVSSSYRGETTLGKKIEADPNLLVLCRRSDPRSEGSTGSRGGSGRSG